MTTSSVAARHAVAEAPPAVGARAMGKRSGGVGGRRGIHKPAYRTTGRAADAPASTAAAKPAASSATTRGELRELFGLGPGRSMSGVLDHLRMELVRLAQSGRRRRHRRGGRGASGGEAGATAKAAARLHSLQAAIAVAEQVRAQPLRIPRPAAA